MTAQDVRERRADRRPGPLRALAAKVWLILCSALATLSLGQSWDRELIANAHRPGPPATPSLSTRPIERIQAGDLVWSRDVLTGEAAARPVLQTFQRVSDHLRMLKIRTATGEIQELKTTDEHPFWATGPGRWIDAGKLRVGQTVLLLGDRPGVVAETSREDRPGGVPVYNFEVDESHTYFAGRSGVLVHNASYGGLSLSGFKAKFGSSFTMEGGEKNVGDTVEKAMARGYYWFKKAATGSDALVIGSLKDTGAAASAGRGSILKPNKGMWNLGINDSWVEGGIARKAQFVLATDVNSAQFIRGATETVPGGMSVYAREISQLLGAGYSFSPDFTRMLPPP